MFDFGVFSSGALCSAFLQPIYVPMSQVLQFLLGGFGKEIAALMSGIWLCDINLWDFSLLPV
jgi:hypothetical protein